MVARVSPMETRTPVTAALVSLERRAHVIMIHAAMVALVYLGMTHLAVTVHKAFWEIAVTMVGLNFSILFIVPR